MKMTIAELKDHLELITGIPYNLQKLSYFDAADLLDDTTIAENRIIPKTEVDLDVWPIWREFVKAAIKGDCFEVFRLGVTHSPSFESPSSHYISYMSENVQRNWINLRAFVALCIGANRGSGLLCSELISNGVNLTLRTPRGRSALHIAAAHGRQEIITLLTENGTKVIEKDSSGWTAVKIAVLFSKTVAEKQLGSIQSKQKYETRWKSAGPGVKRNEADNLKRTQEATQENIEDLNEFPIKKLSKDESTTTSPEDILKAIPSVFVKTNLNKSSNACMIREQASSQIETEVMRETVVQYPAWAVDAHLKQIESVNNTAKLVLLKLQNHEAG